MENAELAFVVAGAAEGEEVFSALEQAQISYDLKAELYDLVCRDGSRAVATIIEKALPRALEGFLVELLTAE